MKLDLTGIHVEITEAINEFVVKKTEKLEKFFDDSTICHVTVSVEKESKIVDVRIEYKGRTYIGKEASEDMYYGLEKVIEKIESQARKTKAIIEKKRREGIAEDVLDALTLDETLSEE